MGQSWSDGSFPVADGQLPSHVIGQQAAVPRHRSDSEPPTSWGGHAVTRIPENEEVNVQTSDMQYADWKKSSRASGILREKPGGLAPMSSAPTTPLSEEPDSDQQQAPKPKLGRSMSVDYTHLADFSMFPDKFSLAPPPPPPPPLPTPPSHNNNFSQQPSRSRHSSSGLSGADETPTTPLSNIANSFFRTRASSASEPMERRTNVEAAAVTKDIEMSEGTDDKTVSAGASLQVPFRPRSSSYSGRFPFFDFSMIPDKDPHFNNSNEGSGQEMRPGQQQQRVRRASSTASSSSSTASTVNVSVPDGSSVVAAALTMAASSPPPSAQPSTHHAVESSKPVKTPQNAPRFTFFDYSLIPDKDPRAFVKTRERKDN